MFFPHDESQLSPTGVLILLVLSTLMGWVLWRGLTWRETETTLERIQRTGIVRIGYANEAPYGYLDSTTGQIKGEAPEIAREIFRRMNVRAVQPVVTEFGSLIPALQAERFDVIAAGMYITPERSREILFSDPTYAIGETFLVLKGNPLDLHSFEDVARQKSARIGVMGGSVEHGYAKQLNTPENRIIIFPDYPTALEGLLTDRVDAVAATVLTANDLLAKLDSSRIEKAEPFRDPVIEGQPVKGFGAFGFRRGDEEFRDRFNRHLREFLGTPEHRAMVKPLGFTEETSANGLTVEEVLEKQNTQE